MTAYLYARRLATAAAFCLFACAAPALADDHDAHHDHEHAHAFESGAIKVVHPWARATGADYGFVFMDIDNHGGADRLVSAATEAAKTVSIVGMTLTSEGAVSHIEIGEIDIPAEHEFKLDPAGVALKLDGLKGPLAKGGDLDLTLTFEKAGEVEIEVEIEAADAKEHSHAGHNH
ncbi:copper chaperone PCu(A)C [Breoghania sp.]|uniref:copper chaperone PCu(A)C n=1 Tax=Breoghania sp. TaxID=2065378 RepID=UPI002AA941D8|nr:copper chaperone PCu(A)C [Breoghania sp.]